MTLPAASPMLHGRAGVPRPVTGDDALPSGGTYGLPRAGGSVALAPTPTEPLSKRAGVRWSSLEGWDIEVLSRAHPPDPHRRRSPGQRHVAVRRLEIAAAVDTRERGVDR